MPIGQIVGAVLFVGGMVVFYTQYAHDTLLKLGWSTATDSKMGLMVLFAGVWGIALHLIIRVVVPSRHRSRLG